MSESSREDLKDNSNKKVLGKFKDEKNSLIIKEFISLNPKVYSVNHLEKNQTINKKVLKGVSKAVVKNEITYNDYVNVLQKNEVLKKDVTSLRSFNHQLYTYRDNKIALTSYYDKMKMLDSINCVPFGYK